MPQTTEISKLTVLDTLLSELASETESQCPLLREHLESARLCMVGAMPEEYRFNLKLAGEALDCVSDENLRFKLERFIQREIDQK